MIATPVSEIGEDQCSSTVQQVTGVHVPEHRIEEVAEVSQLPLGSGPVAGADGLAPSVARCGELDLVFRHPTIKRVEHMEVRTMVAKGGEKPGHRGVCFFVQSK